MTVTYAYDGPLLRQESWSGKVAGTVQVEHDNAFRDSLETVTGASGAFAATFRYDADGMLETIGSLMSLARDPATGFLTGTQAGGVSSALGYDGYGELHTLRYDWSGSAPAWFEQVIDRDALGRVTRVTESGIATGVRGAERSRERCRGRRATTAVYPRAPLDNSPSTPSSSTTARVSWAQYADSAARVRASSAGSGAGEPISSRASSRAAPAPSAIASGA